ncbi:Kinesin-like protein kif27 [Dinochytrium kinnereticum]|nr:Kinesin-like protein kif27 [Dinochytrium kinnereticum]
MQARRRTVAPTTPVPQDRDDALDGLKEAKACSSRRASSSSSAGGGVWTSGSRGFGWNGKKPSGLSTSTSKTFLTGSTVVMGTSSSTNMPRASATSDSTVYHHQQDAAFIKTIDSARTVAYPATSWHSLHNVADYLEYLSPAGSVDLTSPHANAILMASLSNLANNGGAPIAAAAAAQGSPEDSSASHQPLMDRPATATDGPFVSQTLPAAAGPSTTGGGSPNNALVTGSGAKEAITAEDIIDQFKNRYEDEAYSIEEFTASAAFGIQLNVDHPLASARSVTDVARASSTTVSSISNPPPTLTNSNYSYQGVSSGTANISLSFSSDEAPLLNHKSGSNGAKRSSTPENRPSFTRGIPRNAFEPDPPTVSDAATAAASADSSSRGEDTESIKSEMPRFEREIKKRMYPVIFRAGELIIKKHDIGKEMYFLSKGRVEVISGDGRTVYSTINWGSFFGELGVLFNVPRTASVRAVVDCFCMVLTRESLEDVLLYFPHIAARFRTVAEQRMKEVSRKRSYRRRMEVKSKMEIVDELPEETQEEFLESKYFISRIGDEGLKFSRSADTRR